MAEETGALNAIKDSSAPAVEAQPDFARDALDRVQKARADFDAIAAQDKKRYEELAARLEHIDYSKIISYEKTDELDVKKELACTAGVCEIV